MNDNIPEELKSDLEHIDSIKNMLWAGLLPCVLIGLFARLFRSLVSF